MSNGASGSGIIFNAANGVPVSILAGNSLSISVDEVNYPKKYYVVTAEYEGVEHEVVYDFAASQHNSINDINYNFMNYHRETARDGYYYPTSRLKRFKIEEAFDSVINKL